MFTTSSWSVIFSIVFTDFVFYFKNYMTSSDLVINIYHKWCHLLVRYFIQNKPTNTHISPSSSSCMHNQCFSLYLLFITTWCQPTYIWILTLSYTPKFFILLCFLPPFFSSVLFSCLHIWRADKTTKIDRHHFAWPESGHWNASKTHELNQSERLSEKA